MPPDDTARIEEVAHRNRTARTAAVATVAAKYAAVVRHRVDIAGRAGDATAHVS